MSSKLPLSSNTEGREAPGSLSRRAAALRILQQRGTVPLVLAALPPAGAPAKSANDIHQEIGIGSALTVKTILMKIEEAGLANSVLIPKAGIVVERYFNLVPLHPDDFEDATLVYGDGET